MSSVKQQVRQILDRLPDDCSVEDVQYHLYVIEKIRRRLEQAEHGETVPQTEAEARLAKWIVK